MSRLGTENHIKSRLVRSHTSKKCGLGSPSCAEFAQVSARVLICQQTLDQMRALAPDDQRSQVQILPPLPRSGPDQRKRGQGHLLVAGKWGPVPHLFPTYDTQLLPPCCGQHHHRGGIRRSVLAPEILGRDVGVRVSELIGDAGE